MNVSEQSQTVKNQYPCSVCGITSGPRFIDAGLVVCMDRAQCHRRRFGVWPREEPFSLSDFDAIRYPAGGA